MEVQKVNLQEKFGEFADYWNPRIVGELNAQHVKLARLKGDFVWHRHEAEDEMFLVLKGCLRIELRDKTLVLHEGEFVIIPKNTEHRPVAEEEVQVMLFEPMSTLNTGDKDNHFTRRKLENL